MSDTVFDIEIDIYHTAVQISENSAFVTIFSDAQFNGLSMDLGPGRYNFIPGEVGNDNISSIKIPNGLSVTAYVDSGFQGASETFTADVADLGSFDNKISSLIVTGPS